MFAQCSYTVPLWHNANFSVLGDVFMSNTKVDPNMMTVTQPSTARAGATMGKPDQTYMNVTTTPMVLPTPDGGQIVLEEGDWVANPIGFGYYDGIAERVTGLLLLSKIEPARIKALTLKRKLRTGEELQEWQKEAHSKKGKPNTTEKGSVDPTALGDIVAEARSQAAFEAKQK
jgi:hypothetical protein